MGKPVSFNGANAKLNGGAENVADMVAFRNRMGWTSCWELDDAEVAEIVRTRRVFLTCLTGNAAPPPVFLGSEETVRSVIADYGVWPRA